MIIFHDIFISRLNFWDLGGQTELQALWDKYYSECHAIIYTVDSNDRERIDESKRCFDAMISNANINNVPLLVLANKQDLPGTIKYIFLACYMNGKAAFCIHCPFWFPWLIT